MSRPQPINSAATRLDRCVVSAAIVIPSIVTLVYFVWLSSGTSRWQQLAFGAGKTIQFALPVVWVGLTQRPSLAIPRVQTRGWIVGIGFGVVVVVAMMLLYYGALKPYGWFDAAAAQILAKVRGFGVASPLNYFALAAFYALIHSGLEEYYWRWFVFGQLRRFQSVKWAVIVSSLGFMAHHVILLSVFFGGSSPLTYGLAACVAVGGMFWAALYQQTQSIYAPWVSHLIVDAGIFLLGYDIVSAQFTG